MTPDQSPASVFGKRRPTREERRAHGQSVREQVPLASLADVPASADRVSALDVLHGQDADRDQALIPLRYERMAADPFAFLRGSAAVMAADLHPLPTSGISVQLCGDAHVANFGLFASAERTQVFDVNDFDETLPGPFDWDVRRLAASAAVAAQVAGHGDKTARQAAKEAGWRYREAMASLSQMSTLGAWFVTLDLQSLITALEGSHIGGELSKQGRKAEKRTGDAAAAKLTEVVDGRRRFRSEPPLLVPLAEADPSGTLHRLAPLYEQYLATLEPDRAALFEHYSFVDIAQKVVGVGSVGTRAGVMLLESGDGEPILLQVKQAMASVLEPYLGQSRFANHAQRVVVGQRLMQASGDPFLGWVRGGLEGDQDFYLRQLHDMKGGIDTARLSKKAMVEYAGLCGATLARAHGRVGDPSLVSGYLGDTEEFDEAMADFAMAYSALNTADHAALVAAQDAAS